MSKKDNVIDFSRIYEESINSKIKELLNNRSVDSSLEIRKLQIQLSKFKLRNMYVGFNNSKKSDSKKIVFSF